MTNLLYMQPEAALELETTVLEMPSPDILILPETVFYPQGGGQPYDQGIIKGAKGTFQVQEVRNIDGIVHHIGTLSGEIKPGETVRGHVDQERRLLHTRIHSAGHLLDLAVKNTGHSWVPGKGFHFPEGPYVEYTDGFGEVNAEQLQAELQQTANQLIAQDLPVSIEFMDRGEMEKRLPFVPDYLPTNRPSRVVFMGDYGIPCGGTHVSSLQEIGLFSIAKIRMKNGNLRVSYQVN